MSSMPIDLIAMACLYVLAGIMHFVKPGYYRPMMPPFIPAPALMIVLSGVAEIGLGLALFSAELRSLAAWGVIALLAAVWPANIHMALHPESFPKMKPALLWLRVPLQIPLFLWAYRFT